MEVLMSEAVLKHKYTSRILHSRKEMWTESKK